MGWETSLQQVEEREGGKEVDQRSLDTCFQAWLWMEGRGKAADVGGHETGKVRLLRREP